MPRKQKQVDDFITVVRHCCKLLNVQLVFGKGKTVRLDSESVRGYFCPPEGKSAGQLRVATGVPRARWIGVLCHEFGHMSQWFYRDPCFHATLKDGRDPETVMDRWTAGVNYSPATVQEAFDIIRCYERDADDRAMQFIKDYDLPVNLNTYKRDSENMDYSYEQMMNNRKWKYMRRR